MAGGTCGERTERLLAVRLDEAARMLEGCGGSTTRVCRLIELATLATADAVALGLVTAERADRVWRDAGDRHPALVALARRPTLQPARAAA